MINFFIHLWSPTTAIADGLGFSFVHDEQGALIVIGPMMQSDNSNRPPGAIDAIAGSKEWVRRSDVKNPVDIFHDIKRGNRGEPGVKSG